MGLGLQMDDTFPGLVVVGICQRYAVGLTGTGAC